MPQGADWRCEATQQLRFVQLLKLCNRAGIYSLNDVGCGYGALLAFLARRRRLAHVDYFGIDIAPAMIEAARRRWPRHAHRFAVGRVAERVADYSVASGIFNVRLDMPLRLWESFVAQTLLDLRQTSRHGFAVNFMRPLPPGIPSPRQLYRARPGFWEVHCEAEFGATVEVISAYGMHEETLLVRY